jgi:hypothetical protein
MGLGEFGGSSCSSPVSMLQVFLWFFCVSLVAFLEDSLQVAGTTHDRIPWEFHVLMAAYTVSKELIKISCLVLYQQFLSLVFFSRFWDGIYPLTSVFC